MTTEIVPSDEKRLDARPAKVPRFKFNSGSQYEAYAIRRKTKLIHGGLGSGKSTLHYLHYIEQGQIGATSQIHGLFCNSANQLNSGILEETRKRLLQCGIPTVYNTIPPIDWFRYWDKKQIEIPIISSYRGYLTLPTGVHVACGTLYNVKSYEQWRSVQFRTLRIDEIFICPQGAIMTMIPRCRCGDADDEFGVDADIDSPPHCGHLHDVTLIGNPPLGAHWIFNWLDQRERAAKKYHDGSPANHLNWELLRRGVGNMIMIKSSSRDNVRNLGAAAIEDLEDNMNPDVAARLIDGDIIRESAGRAFKWFTTEGNVSPVEYDESRRVYVWMDFDLRPGTAVFVHELHRNEYPDQGERDTGIRHYGVFGEYFSEQPQSVDEMMRDIIHGGRGNGGDCAYPDENLRGFPANWKGLIGHRGDIVFSGDARGKERSRHNKQGLGDWGLVRQALREELGEEGQWSLNIPDKATNPDPVLRIQTTNTKFCNAKKVRSLHLDPRCVHLRKDAESCTWNDQMTDLYHVGYGWGGGTEWMRANIIVALGYGLCVVAPMGIDRSMTRDLETILEDENDDIAATEEYLNEAIELRAPLRY